MRGNMLRSTLIIALIPLLLAGCLFGPETSTPEIDPPPDTTAVDHDTEDEDGEDGEIKETNAEAVETEEETADSSDQVSVELYFKSPEGYVVPYAVAVPKKEGIAEEALNYMIEGGPIAKLDSALPEGFSPLLPEGTQILSLNIKKNGVANVDVSKEFLEYETEDEEKILGAVTWALTAWDSVDKVNLWINGEPLEFMPKGNTPAVGMTRKNTALNIEVAEGVQISDSMPVTLYFLGQSDETTYFVPVTRMVQRNEDVAEATINQLIAGPLKASNLSTEILDNLDVHDIAVEEKTVLADFGEQLLEYGQENRASEHAIQSIVLSLTENTGAEQVKISVNGKTDVTSQNVSLAEPVNRPDKINPLSL